MGEIATSQGIGGFIGRRLVLVYAVGVFGAFLQIAGGSWDVASHALGIPDTFFTPSHTILYAGVGLAALAGISGVLLRLTAVRGIPTMRPLVAGLQVSFGGTVLQVIAGPADLYWHDTFGFDPFLLTPAHSLLIGGIILVGVGMAIGSARLLRAHGAGVDVGTTPGGRRALEASAVVAFAVLWLGLNGLVYLVTDVEGMAYTFGLGPGFVARYEGVAFTVAPVALALTGTLVLLAARRVVGRPGAATAVAAIAASVVGLANVGFRASYLQGTPAGAAIAGYLPLHAAFLLPVVLFDLALRRTESRPRVLLAAALVAPFASFLDGWHGTFLWTAGRDLLPLLVVPMIAAGALAGFLSVRFTDALLATRRATAAGA